MEKFFRGRKRPARSAASTRETVLSTGSMPISQLIFSFITSLAMFRKCPGWKSPTETVRSERTHSSAMPLSPFRPLLISTATT